MTPELRPDVRKILILNPAPGAARFTSARRAARYIERQQARWADAAKARIVFTDRETRLALIEQDELDRLQTHDRISRPMTAAEIAAIPVVMPEKLIAPTASGSFRRSTDGRTRPGRHLVKGGHPLSATLPPSPLRVLPGPPPVEVWTTAAGL